MRVIRGIFAPTDITATSAAREKLDDHIADFRQDCQLHDFFLTAELLHESLLGATPSGDTG
jgi:hypothetical protein